MSNSIILKESTIDSLMAVICKNTEPSTCIDTFGLLLNEINDKQTVKTFISDLNKFIEEFMTLVRDVDRMETIRFKSKVLTDDFIQPERFFKTSKAIVGNYIRLNAAINYYFTDNNPETIKRFILGKRNRLGNPTARQYTSDEKTAYRTMCDFGLFSFISFDFKTGDVKTDHTITKDNYQYYQEECRKVILLWNYMPAIVKAFVQTKRRDLGLDSNSKRFSKRNLTSNK